MTNRRPAFYSILLSLLIALVAAYSVDAWMFPGDGARRASALEVQAPKPQPSGTVSAAATSTKAPQGVVGGPNRTATPTPTVAVTSTPSPVPSISPTLASTATQPPAASSVPTTPTTTGGAGTATATIPAATATTPMATATTPTATASPIATTPAATTTVVATATATGTPTATPTVAVAGSNDDFNSATVINSFPATITIVDTSGATVANDDPDMGINGKNTHTVWFRFVAPSSGKVRASTRGSGYDTVLAAYSGARGSLTRLESNDDAPNQTETYSEITFSVQSGTTYYLEVAQYEGMGSGGKLVLGAEIGDFAVTSTATPTPTATSYTWYWPTTTSYTPTPTPTPGVAPSNDDIGSAVVIDNFPFTDSRDTTGATTASDDPQMGGGTGTNANTVWYRFTASSAGSVRATTVDSDYDTVLAAFSGSRGSLALVASNDDISPDVQSEVRFNVQAGVTYYLEVAQYGSASGGGQLRFRVESGVGLASVTPTATTTAVTGTPMAIGTPSVLGSAPVAIPPAARSSNLVLMDNRYFVETGFRVNLEPIWDYFQKRGGVRTFGYPISWEFPFMGFKVQFFQRAILQMTPGGSVVSMNLMDEGLMPYTQINGSTFPRVEKELKETAPSPSDPDYGRKALAFLQANVPDEWEGMQVNFLKAYMGTVRYEDAFPNGEEDASLVPLLNLELWGLPTSRPTADPNNAGFVFQRFQRGIMHYDATTGATQGLLLADYMKSIITGQNLPLDLDGQARSSRFYHQLDPNKPGHLARPADLGGTNLQDAFTRVLE